MSRRRRRRTPATEVDSLELGLDMVCNCFGGIIFIMLMTVIPPAVSGDAPALATEPSAAQLIDRSELHVQIRAAQASIDALAATIQSGTAEDDTAKARADLKNQIEIATNNLNDLMSGTDELRHKLAHEQRLLEQRRRVDQTLQHMTSELLSKNATSITESRLPIIHLTKKARLFVVLKNNRVYLPQKVIDGNFYLNDTDFDIVKKAGITGLFTALPDRGTDYHSFIAGSDTFKELCRQLPVDQFLFDICVYPDSAEAFDAVKNAFTSRGYDYFWFALNQDQSLQLVPDHSHTAEGM